MTVGSSAYPHPACFLILRVEVHGLLERQLAAAQWVDAQVQAVGAAAPRAAAAAAARAAAQGHHRARPVAQDAGLWRCTAGDVGRDVTPRRHAEGRST